MVENSEMGSMNKLVALPFVIVLLPFYGFIWFAIWIWKGIWEWFPKGEGSGI